MGRRIEREKNGNKQTCLIGVAIGQPIETVAGKSHVVGFDQPENAGGGHGGPTSQRGSRRTEREGLRRGERAGSAVCGPIGWEGVHSHECNALGGPSKVPWREEGRFPNLNVGKRFISGPQNGLARAVRSG